MKHINSQNCNRRLLLLIILLYSVFQHTSAQSAGVLDSSFGHYGLVNSGLGGIATAFQSTDKILLAGYAGIQRYNTDGSLDHTFGINGTAISDFHISSIAVESDDKFVVTGNEGSVLAVARYNRDGSRDSTFGNGGKKTTDIGLNTAYSVFTSVTLQSDHKIVVAGSSSALVLVRYNKNGTLDSSFNGSGIITTGIAPPSPSARFVTIQNDGKIIALGEDLSYTHIVVLRYNTDGSPDNSFAGNGTDVVDFFNASANSIALSKEGKIVISGGLNYYYPFEDEVMCVVQLNSNGSLDSSFSNDGKQFLDLDVWKFGAFTYSVAVQDDNKILIGGESFTPHALIVVRFSTNGNVDSTFSNNGLQEIPISQYNVFVSDLAIRKNKLYAVNYPYGMARYQLGSPNITITSPANNSAFILPATIHINASAFIPGEIVNKVKFYNGRMLLATDTTGPYSFNWSNLSQGDYSLTAVAFFNAADSLSSDQVHVSVIADQPPVVSFEAPVENATFEGPANILLKASARATQAGGVIAQVSFYNGTTLLADFADSPYVYNWSNVAPGNYTITAKAINNIGLADSATVHFIVTYPKPTFGFNLNNTALYNINNGIPDVSESDTFNVCENVAFTTSGHFFNSPDNLYDIKVNATGGVLLFDGNQAGNAVLTGAQLAATAGSHTLNMVNINYPGTVIQTITPFTDVDHSGTLTATDITGDPLVFTYVGMVKQTWYLDADHDQHAIQSILSCTSPGVNWTLTKLPVDDCDDSDPDPCPNIPPTVKISSPASGTNFIVPGSINITVDAIDSGGAVTSVSVYNGSTLLFTDSTAPYTGQWLSVPTGDYYITAVATDNSGLTTTSAPVHITVIHNRPPDVVITNPAEGASFTAPATIVLSADAASHGGKLTSVKFYSGNTLLHIESDAPYVWSWKNILPGNYSITAKATDNLNRVTTSSPVHITVTQSCSSASQPTFGLNFNGIPTYNTNNGVVDPGESASITLCDGGHYTTSGHFNSSPSNLYRITVTSTGGTLLFDGNLARNVILTAAELSATAGTHTVILNDHVTGGTLVQTVLPFTDNNNNHKLDTGDCIGDPVVYTLSAGVCNNKPVTQSRSSYPLKNSTESDISITLHPNPAKNILNIYTIGLNINKQVDISVLSSSGIVMKTVQAKAPIQIIPVNISSLLSGMYIIKIMSDDRIFYKQFIKL